LRLFSFKYYFYGYFICYDGDDIFGGPNSVNDLILKLTTFVAMLSLSSCFTLGLVMLFGTLLGKREALIISLAYIIYEWLFQLGTITSVLTLMPTLKDLGLIDPAQLYMKTYFTTSAIPGYELLSAARPYVAWLQDSYPYLTLMVLEVIIIILIDCAIFSREEA